MAAPGILRNLAVAARGIWILLAGLVLLVALAIGALFVLDQPFGHRFVVSQVRQLTFDNGLGIEIEKIEGSIFGKLRVTNLKLRDPRGVFLIVPVADLVWRPRDLLVNRITVNSAVAPDAYILKLPDLDPTENPNILPDIDIFVGRLQIDRLSLGPEIAARRQQLRIDGNADIHAGRALVNLSALSGTGGDTILVKLDIEPDRNRFDVGARINAVAGGALLKLTGVKLPFSVQLVGDGGWRNWRGALQAETRADQLPTPLAALKLQGNDGRFKAAGQVTPAALLDGVAARLLTPAIDIVADIAFVDQRGDIQAQLTSPALEVTAAGQIDFSTETFKGFTVDARLLRPQAVDPRLGGTNIRLQSRFAGNMSAPLVDYLLAGAQVRFEALAIEALRVSGVVQLGKPTLVVPVTASARRIVGAGATLDPLLANLRADTLVTLTGARIEARALTLRTDRLTAKGSVTVVPTAGSFNALLTAELPRYAVPNLGTANIATTVTIAGTRAGIRATGTARAVMASIANDGLLRMTGGLPAFAAQFERAPDGTLAVRDARLTAPGLNLMGAGGLTPAGVMGFAASGQSREFGPVTINAAGPIDRLKIDLRLARPGLGMDITDLTARVAAIPTGWSFDAAAQSSAGPVSATGSIATGAGPMTIALTRLTAAGLVARGTLVQTSTGPFAGRLEVEGKGLNGGAVLSAAGSAQLAEINLDIANAVVALVTPVSIGKGTARANVRLASGSEPPVINAYFSLGDVQRGDLMLSSAQGRLDFGSGSGTMDVAVKGDAGVPFGFAATGQLRGDTLVVVATGNIAGTSLKLDRPAALTRRDGNWQLAKTSVITPNGRIEVGGSFGNDIALQLRLDRFGLGLVRIFNPALDLSGSVSGSIDFNYPAAAQLPTARAELRVNGLSRAGIGTASTRIDIGINALLANGRASTRMTIAREGRIEGRAQAQLAVIPGSRADPLLTRLFAAPVFAQLRWAGPAQALWPLAGVDRLDVRGPIVVAIDGSGVLGDPRFAGTVTAKGARIESTGIGLVLDRIAMESRFTGSRLELTSFSAGAGRDGTISASGGIDLSAVRNFPMDFALDMRNAMLINRDDLRGAATGTVRIRSGADGARISGNLDIDQARITLGSASVADVPALVVTEINGAAAKRPVARPAKPTIWQLDLGVEADNRLMVRGMGLDSEWSADVRVTGSIEAPRVTGKVALVRGDYDFAGKRFTLTRGDVRFTGNYPPDPIISITAENTSSNFTATLKITGTAQRPMISFSSIPALPEDEVLSRVLFGESITNLSAPEAIQLAGALATLRGGNGGLNPINAIRKGLGIDRLRILPADTTRGRKTSIAAGQYIGDRVYVEVTSDAQGFSSTSVEVSLTRSLSILSEIATLGGTSLNVRWKRDY